MKCSDPDSNKSPTMFTPSGTFSILRAPSDTPAPPPHPVDSMLHTPPGNTNHVLMVDGDNISPKYIRDILDDIKERGPLGLFRLYCDFRNHPEWQEVVESHPVVAIQVYSDRKQAVDLCMTADGVECILTQPRPCTLCVASGDRDFTHLMLKANHAGIRVIGYATGKQASHRLQSYCDEFIQFGAEDGAEERTKEAPLPTAREKVQQIVRGAIEENPCYHPSQLLDRLKRMDPSYNHKNQGYTTFKRWMLDLGFDVDESTVRVRN